jgi:GNAT superfamily N-acetyltransferase
MTFALESLLKPLDWDSAHFGLKVGRIESPDIDDSDLCDLLIAAGHNGFSLLYWATRDSRHLPENILNRCSGFHVDRKTTYLIDLGRQAFRKPSADPSRAVRVVEYPRKPASAALLRLGRAASALSRFVRDPHVQPAKTAELYDIWTNKSTLGEMADVVFVARFADFPEDEVGMVTVAKERDDGRIGLIAVDSMVRGIGIGTALVKAANDWMAGKDLARGWVVTQGGNAKACRLYEAAGYRVYRAENVYHFWPLKGQIGRP